MGKSETMETLLRRFQIQNATEALKRLVQNAGYNTEVEPSIPRNRGAGIVHLGAYPGVRAYVLKDGEAEGIWNHEEIQQIHPEFTKEKVEQMFNEVEAEKKNRS